MPPKNEKIIPPFSATPIIPGLWLGDSQDALSFFLLKEKQIDIIINCTPDDPFIAGDTEIIKKRIPINDDTKHYYQINEKLYTYLDAITSFIFSQLNLGKKIFIYCHSGRQTAPAIVSAYFMRYGKVDKQQAINYVRMKRPKAFRPAINFNHALEKYEKQLKS